MSSATHKKTYQEGGDVRRRFAGQIEPARRYYEKYINFLDHVIDEDSQDILDMGCGAGWSSYLLAERGHRVTAMDLDPKGFEAPSADGPRYVTGDGTRLPFRPTSFDIVTSFQAVEHIDDPEAALGEMLRVVRPGGLIIVAGPNLLSLGLSVRQLPRALMGKTGDRHSPFGNTVGQAAITLLRNSYRIAKGTITGNPDFQFREPDLRPPYAGDSDACFLLNPQDIANWFRTRGCQIVAQDYPGRLKASRYLAGGTWVAVRRGRV